MERIDPKSSPRSVYSLSLLYSEETLQKSVEEKRVQKTAEKGSQRKLFEQDGHKAEQRVANSAAVRSAST